MGAKEEKQIGIIQYLMLCIFLWGSFNPTHMILMYLFTAYYGVFGFVCYASFWYIYSAHIVPCREWRAPLGYWFDMRRLAELLFKDPNKIFKVVFEDKSEFDSLQGKGRSCVSVTHGIIPFSFMMSTVNYTPESSPAYHWSLRMMNILSIFFKDAETVDANNVKRMMREKQDFNITLGGFIEVALYKYGEYRCYVKPKGLIKYALQHGYNLFPMFSFGEERMYYTINIWQKQRLYLAKHWNLPMMTLCFSPNFLFHPMIGSGTTTVIGKAIKLPRIENPSQEDIDKHHTLFLEEVRRIFKENVEKYGDPSQPLQLFKD